LLTQPLDLQPAVLDLLLGRLYLATQRLDSSFGGIDLLVCGGQSRVLLGNPAVEAKGNLHLRLWLSGGQVDGAVSQVVGGGPF
jgi:hypothetical protein